MRLFYTISIWFFGIVARLYSMVNSKAKKWVQGRKDWDKKLKAAVGDIENPIWFHCSSLGEFEQGRPIIEGLAAKGEKVILTFFSPSGFENLKNYKYAEIVTYLPLDTPSNAKKWISIINPKAAIFVKYEFWYNYMYALKNRDIPFYLISGIFRKSQYFFKWYGTWFSDKLQDFNHLFVQDNESMNLLKSIKINQSSVSGDTRFDRVLDIASKPKDVELVEKFTKDKFSIIAGSTWPKDEEVLLKYIEQDKEAVLVLAPHDIDSQHISAILKTSKGNGVLYSNGHFDKERVLIINQIGLLSSIYRYGSVAYIGGGFGNGIHNTLEAAVYGKALVFGPNYERFREARDMIEKKGAMSISNEKDFQQIMSVLRTDENRNQMGTINKAYIDKEKGGSILILNKLKEQGIF